MTPSAPYQWRADGGYLPTTPPAEEASPAPPPYTPAGPAPGPNMFYFPGQQVLPYNIYSHPAYLPGPIGIGGVYIPPQTVQEGAGGIPRPSPRPAPPSPPAPPPNSPQKRKGDDEGDAEKKVKKPKKKPNPYAPPPLRPGVNFLFPRETTQLHVFKKAAKVWDKKYEGQDLGFKIWAADTQMTVRSLIERVMGAVDEAEAGEKCGGWAATEVLERGGGKWYKGTTIEYTSDKAKGTLSSMSWNGKRGESLPPVWISVHKV